MAIAVSFQELRPAFFKNHHPYIFILSRFGAECFFGFYDHRKEVINYDLLINSVEVHFADVVAIGIVLLSCEKLVNSVWSLS